MIGQEATSTANYKILDAWARINTCLRHEALAEQAIARLDRMGYRDPAFLRFTAAHRPR